MRIRFVTGNPGKAEEAKAALAGLAEVERVDAPVTEVQADDLATVARAKADALRGRVDEPYFVDDGGLFVHALGGFPGVYSNYVLRTLGVDGILRLVDGKDRGAHFACVVAYVADGRTRLVDGRCDGRLAPAPRAAGHGFGFDPIFVPDGDTRTFAEIPVEEKNRVSHRGKALGALARHIAPKGRPK